VGEHGDRGPADGDPAQANGEPAQGDEPSGAPADGAAIGGEQADGAAKAGGGADRSAGGERADEPARDRGEGDRSRAGRGGAGTARGASAAAPGPAQPEDPGELLGEVRAIRRRARLARHAYWFPLVLFGLLTCASVPFYLPPTRSGVYPGSPPGPMFLQSGYLGGFGIDSYKGTAYYWLGAMLLGIAATVLWYRWRGSRVGLRTPSRGYLSAGLIILALALVIPLAGRGAGVGMLAIMPGDLLVRGTFPIVLIGLGLCVLAWAERSAGLAVIAAAYLALTLLASLYDIENVFYNWFGWTLGPTASALPNVLLPALVLLLSGAGAWVVQRRIRPPGEWVPEG
jgi:hypothetical protein